MLEAIDRYLPSGISFDPPKGGLFVWLRLPKSLPASELLPVACKAGVSFVPGNYFFTDGKSGNEWIRLNFASQPEEAITEGIKRLGQAMRKMNVRK